MLLMVIAGVAIIVIGCILKKFFHDISKFESDMLSPSIKDLEDTSSSYKAIKKALKNTQDL